MCNIGKFLILCVFGVLIGCVGPFPDPPDTAGDTGVVPADGQIDATIPQDATSAVDMAIPVCPPNDDPEVCNNRVDDNCDGQVDEGCECGLDEFRACEGGTNEGACNTGNETCVDGHWSHVCVGRIDPIDETCLDGRDNDCDGTADEDPEQLCQRCDRAELGQDCTTGQPGICANGHTVCTEGVVRCEANLQPQPIDTCDGQNSDCDGDTDEDGDQVQDNACGQNGRGRQTLRCVNGVLNEVECVDPDVCLDNHSIFEVCGLNDNGTRRRSCANGQWGEWEPCIDPDVCRNGMRENRACEVSNAPGAEPFLCVLGQWQSDGACVAGMAVCNNDTVEDRPCGLNLRGSETRTCVDGNWDDWGACGDPDACVDNTSERGACGFNDRGFQDRQCIAGQWGAFAPCQEVDECANDTNEVRECGLGGESRRVCINGLWSAWGGCQGGGVCADGATEDRVCGLNRDGIETRLCTDGVWSGWNACDSNDICVNGTMGEQDCGDGGRQNRTCVDGNWNDWSVCNEGPECQNGAEENRACGRNDRGVENRTCANGRWGNWINCVDPDVCNDGQSEVEVCGLNDNGTARRTCESGQWSPFGDCVDPDVCVNNTNRPCGPDNDVGLCSRGTERCMLGQWGQCLGAVAPAVEVCDEQDNDCDGQTDEGLPLCGCVPQNEVCEDNLDNDCDGRTDEGCPPRCVPSPEVCDGLDNDCDGSVDGTLYGEFEHLLCSNQVRDIMTGLLWDFQSAPPASSELTQPRAAAACANQGKRLPTFDEVRRIINGCPGTEDGGACGYTNQCLGVLCNNDNCGACFVDPGPNQGPGWQGCYLATPFQGNATQGCRHEWLSNCEGSNCGVFTASEGGLVMIMDSRFYSHRCVQDP